MNHGCKGGQGRDDEEVAITGWVVLVGLGAPIVVIVAIWQLVAWLVL